jgi:RNA polymerase sigma-70 factor (ECF subfamily)
MRDITFSELDRLRTEVLDDKFQMDQETFHALYERTARSLWVYLLRRTGDEQLAEDLLQETYYRFLRVRAVHESEAHRRNYLFRIASNLVKDAHRSRQSHVPVPDESEPGHPTADPDTIGRNARRAELDRALVKLSGRQRDALWLAYAEGSSHIEIAERLGVKAASVRLILFRARRKLARLLRNATRSQS